MSAGGKEFPEVKSHGTLNWPFTCVSAGVHGFSPPQSYTASVKKCTCIRSEVCTAVEIRFVVFCPMTHEDRSNMFLRNVSSAYETVRCHGQEGYSLKVITILYSWGNDENLGNIKWGYFAQTRFPAPVWCLTFVCPSKRYVPCGTIRLLTLNFTTCTLIICSFTGIDLKCDVEPMFVVQHNSSKLC